MSPVTTASSGPRITVPDTGLLVSSSNFSRLACFFLGLGAAVFSPLLVCFGVDEEAPLPSPEVGGARSSSRGLLRGHCGGDGVLGGVMGACTLCK